VRPAIDIVSSTISMCRLRTCPPATSQVPLGALAHRRRVTFDLLLAERRGARAAVAWPSVLCSEQAITQEKLKCGVLDEPAIFRDQDTSMSAGWLSSMRRRLLARK
jgi:hypothetical protein